MWDDYDTDKDGYMTQSEASNLIKDCFGHSNVFDDKKIKTTFESMDKDGDGRVTKSEMADFVWKQTYFKKNWGEGWSVAHAHISFHII